MLQTAIILAGGFGTRLQSLVSDVPKPMAPVCGQPFLYYQLKFLKHHGIKTIIFSVGYLNEAVSRFFGERFGGMTIAYALEPEPLGTGGGIRLGMERCPDTDVLVLNGDSFFDFDLTQYIRLHRQSGRNISLALRRVSDVSRYGSISVNDHHRVLAFSEKSSQAGTGLINAGVYILNKNYYLQQSKAGQAFSIERDFFPSQASITSLNGYEFDGYFIDIGIPEDYTRAQDEFKGFKY